MPRLEQLDPLKCPKQGVLDKIIGIGETARPFRQASGRPALKGLEVAGKQAVERVLIASFGALDQLKGRFEIANRRILP